MDEQAFKQWTKAIALRTIKLVEALPASSLGEVLGKQLLRSEPVLAPTIGLFAGRSHLRT